MPLPRHRAPRKRPSDRVQTRGALQNLRHLHQTWIADLIDVFRCEFLMHNARMLYGYARVSTDAQGLSNQVAQLKAAGCSRIFRGEAQRRDRRAAPAQESDGGPYPGDVVVIPAIYRLSQLPSIRRGR